VALRDIDSIKQVLVSIVVEVSAKRFVIQVIGTCAKDLVGSGWCLLWFLLDHGLLFRLGWRFEVDVSVETVLLEFDRLDLHRLDLFEILFVVQAVAEYVAERA
jgi:hypothetical protein